VDESGTVVEADEGFADAFGVLRAADFFRSLSNGGVTKFSRLGMGCFYK
jgi:hypothetical protein